MNISSSSRLTVSPFLCGLIALLWAACGGSKSSPEQTGQSCAPTQEDATGGCFKDLKESILGTPTCLTRVPEGYCTHTCNTDSDCCAVKGECKSGLAQVCAPFESTGAKYCFLSCEAKDITDGTDDTTFCQENANAAFLCRSTGGGKENRKVCVPNG